MRKTIKKSLALVLSLMMLLSVVPMVFADCDHEYTEVSQWLWSDDGLACTAKVICTKCSQPAYFDASVSKNTASSSAATCTADGKNVMVAVVALSSTNIVNDIKEVTVPKTGHNFIGAIVSNGNGTHSWKCVNAGCTALGYVNDQGKSVEGSKACSGGTATCTEKAICEECNTAYGEEPTHQLVKVNEVKATCKTAGNIAYYKCTVDSCGKFFSDAAGKEEIVDHDSVVIPAIGGNHIASEEYTRFANDGGAFDCTAGGYKVKLCEKCGAQIDSTRIAIPASGHSQADDWTYVDKNGGTFDCTVGGYKVKLCVTCGKEIAGTKTDVAKGAHANVNHPKVEPTCEEDGMNAYMSCKICGKYVTEPVILAATGHTWVTIAKKDATCSAQGNVKYWKCSKCGAVSPDEDHARKYYDDEDMTAEDAQTAQEKAGVLLDKTDHKFQQEVKAKAPDCTTDGTRQVFKCKTCGQLAVVLDYTYDDEEVDYYYNYMSGNYFVDIANLNEAKIQKLGHTWVKDYEGVNYVAPTCSKEGQCNAFCAVCKIPTVLTLDKLPHQSKRMIKAVEPTCERGKYEIHECKVCGQTYEVDLYDPDLPESVDQSKIKPIGHNFSGFVTQIQEATCTQIGIRGRACLNGCGKYLDGVESPMLAHNLSSVKVEPDGHTPGYTGKKCSMCGQVFDKVEIAPASLDHIDKSPVDGKCDVCGYIMCDHICHDENAFKKIIWFVAKLWYQFLGINPVCKCGALHYTKSGDINVPA